MIIFNHLMKLNQGIDVAKRYIFSEYNTETLTDTLWKHAAHSSNYWLKFTTKQQQPDNIPLLKCWPKLTATHPSWVHNKGGTYCKQQKYNAYPLSILNYDHQFFFVISKIVI